MPKYLRAKIVFMHCHGTHLFVFALIIDLAVQDAPVVFVFHFFVWHSVVGFVLLCYCLLLFSS